MAASVVAAVLAVVIPAAIAGSVNVSRTTPDTASFRGFLGETNDLDINRSNITDSLNPLAVGGGCTSTGPNSATCVRSSPGVSQPNWDVRMSDGNDSAHVVVDLVAKVYGGAGDDHMSADSFGQHTEVYGQGGDDDITAGGEGGQIADGGGGDDVIHAGGFAGDASGLGGPGNDLIFYGSGLLSGTITLGGGTGNDTIVARPGGPNSTASGDDGNDVIVIDGPPSSGAGVFTVSGGAGDDTLVGGPLPDTIDGGIGRDFIDVRGGGADTVTCGDGVDVVLYDASDTIDPDCEVTRVG